jgi:KaiC/GvpD/RAD55 family RecA-like ATPase
MKIDEGQRMKNNTEVFPGASRLVHGIVPSSSLLLIGPTGVGKTIFCKHFFYNGLLMNKPSIYVTTNETPEEIQASMKAFGLDIKLFKEQGLVRIVDGCSWKLGGKPSSKYAIDSQQNYLTAISIKIKKARQDLKETSLVFDSVSELAALSNPDVVLNFLQVLTTRIRSDGGRAIFVVASGAHDDHFMNLLRMTFDGILEMKIDDSGREIKRLLRIFSLKGIEHRTDWTPFNITDRGIVLIGGTDIRCALCSKRVYWAPITKTINGKKYYFDSQECLKTYKKYKSVYGKSFE